MTDAARYTANALLLGGSFVRYWGRYFGSRHFPENQEYYVVYTNVDHSIPFEPNSSSEYWLVNLRLVPTAVRLGDPSSGSDFAAIRTGYVEIAREGSSAFMEVPTIMPHFDRRAGAAARATRTFLKPINCCPSLHTAAPFFAYNAGSSHFPEKRELLRKCVADVVSTVIKSKFHAIIDVSFGIFVAQKAVERMGLDFDDLQSYFVQCQKARDQVPYDEVYRMYREIRDLAKVTNCKRIGTAELMRRYFQEIGLPRVGRQQSNCYFDLQSNGLVYAPELKVGKGLI